MRKCVDVVDDYCFESKDVWLIMLPSDSEKIIASATRKLNEVRYFTFVGLSHDIFLCMVYLPNIHFGNAA